MTEQNENAERIHTHADRAKHAFDVDNEITEQARAAGKSKVILSKNSSQPPSGI